MAAAALGGVSAVGSSQGKIVLTANSPKGTGSKHSDILLVTHHRSAVAILIFNASAQDASPIKKELTCAPKICDAIEMIASGNANNQIDDTCQLEI